jgi:A/G-specific adenine glycosylase
MNLAQIVATEHRGEIPHLKEELLELPGIGDYIANAVLCFAYGESVPLLDTNIIRILERVFGIRSSKVRARTDKELWKAVERIIPPGKAKEFNLAMLDLAALICTSRNPKCSICPTADICKSRG